MSTDRDTTRIVRSWLMTDEHESADRVLGAVLDRLDTTPQRRATWWPVRRFPLMNKIVGFGLAAAAVLAILLIGSQLVASPANVGGPGTDATASPQPASVTPSVEPSVAEPTSTPETGLPQGPFELVWDGLVENAPRITLTIPASGWTTSTGGVVEKGSEADNMPEAAIIAFSEPPGSGFYVYGDPCRWESTRPESPATTVDEIVTALAAQASRDASEPVDVAVGGYAGKVITLHVPDDINIGDCEGPEFATFGTETEDLARYHQGPGQIDELWIIDVDGAIVIIDAMYRADTSAELLDELRSLAESATFETP